MLAGLECGEDLGVHVDSKILFGYNLFISCLDGPVDPVTKGLTYDGIDNIT